MAAVTFTASERTSGVRHMPSGVITKSSLFTLSTGGSASSIFLLCRVPDRATILDFSFFVDDAGGSGTANQAVNNTWQLGFSMPEGSSSVTLTKSAISPAQANLVGGTVIRPTGVNLPVTLSISSECPQRWAWICATPSITPSASAVMKFSVKYTMDGA
jgi:hypothetical protein